MKTTSTEISKGSVREDLVIFISFVVGTVFFILFLSLIVALLLAALLATLFTLGLTIWAATYYAEIMTWPGIWLTCVASSFVFGALRNAPGQKPRRFFDMLAQGGVWFFGIIAFVSLFGVLVFGLLFVMTNYPLPSVALWLSILLYMSFQSRAERALKAKIANRSETAETEPDLPPSQ